jgi:hypothetical protein
MQKHVAEFIGTLFLVLANGCTVDPDRHSVGGDECEDDLLQPSASQQDWPQQQPACNSNR